MSRPPSAARRVAAAVLAWALAVTLLAAGTASAAVTAGASGERVVYFFVHGTDSSDSVTISGPFGSEENPYISISSPEGAAPEGYGCEAWTATEIHCGVRYVDDFFVRLGDGEDELFLGDYTPGSLVGVSLGAGDDTAAGSKGADSIDAGPGADTVLAARATTSFPDSTAPTGCSAAGDR